MKELDWNNTGSLLTVHAICNIGWFNYNKFISGRDDQSKWKFEDMIMTALILMNFFFFLTIFAIFLNSKSLSIVNNFIWTHVIVMFFLLNFNG